jgi:hypothetical protein
MPRVCPEGVSTGIVVHEKHTLPFNTPRPRDHRFPDSLGMIGACGFADLGNR